MRNKTILILASNPEKDLNLDYEIHALKNIIEESESFQEFNVIIDDAISPNNIQSLFHEHQPRIVHFCGHGSEENGLVFIDSSSGKGQPVHPQALSNLFKKFENTIECVLLNACYSAVQAKEIAKHINYAIGVNQAIRDDAAIFFAKGFYQALGKDNQITECFGFGENEIRLGLSKITGKPRKFEVLDEEGEIIPEHLKPIIETKDNLTLFPEDIAKQQTNVNEKEYRFRKILLDKVHEYWIEGVLEKSRQIGALLELGIQKRSDLVHNPFSKYQELPVEPNSSYKWLNATNAFEQMKGGRTLLILGKGGSGKTIALLKLAKRLIKKAKYDSSLPIPVVFNLSSWASKRKPIAEWLVIELKEKYGVSKSLAKQWIEREQLLLLLDGLDEVNEEYRNNCVKAINQFLDFYKLTEIVVCSRLQEYELLTEILQLRNAIYIQPLTSERIDWYLKDTGIELNGLKTLLRNDSEIRDFAKTPLILSIMTLTYQNCSSEDIRQQLNSHTNRYKNLFNKYIERMLYRRKNSKYSPKQIINWIALLSEFMKKEDLNIFQIEKLQPSFFDEKSERRKNRGYNSVLTMINTKRIYQFCNFALTIIFTTGITFGATRQKIFSIFSGLFFGLLVCLSPSEIMLFEEIKLFEQNLSSIVYNGKLAIQIALISGLFICLLLIPNLGVIGVKSVLGVSVTLGLVLAMSIFMILSVSSAPFNKEVSQKTKANQGIWLSLKNSLLLGLVSYLLSIVILCFDSTNNDADISVAIIAGIFFWLPNGGATCIKHFSLRCILYCRGYAPCNYAQFLDYASNILLMTKVGGGYMIYHPMLMEHFANMKLKNKPRAK